MGIFVTEAVTSMSLLPSQEVVSSGGRLKRERERGRERERERERGKERERERANNTGVLCDFHIVFLRNVNKCVWRDTYISPYIHVLFHYSQEMK